MGTGKFNQSLNLFAVFLSLWLGQSAMAGPFPGMEKVEAALALEATREGEAAYLVYLKERADVSGAPAIRNWGERGRFVHQRLKKAAESGQAPLLAFLKRERAAGESLQIQSFFIINALVVRSSERVMKTLAAFPGVERIESLPVIAIPEPVPTIEAVPKVNGIEWGLARVGAPEVWADGFTGAGITVANIDTGVENDHPALASQYRGKGGHAHNWWDATGECGSGAPCDNHGHGTHTMGTMVGDDGAGNRIGVAPGASWMACKACKADGTCPEVALLECAEFILAPWDLDRKNADATKRPHVVNNSWGMFSGFLFFEEAVDNWRAAGIFPAFAVGNRGDGCKSAVFPGDYPQSFATGAIDDENQIAGSSSRGPSFTKNGVIKPDIVAPGVSIRSSVPCGPSGCYESWNGTSMASPHTAGVVALLWSRYPGLKRDIGGTEAKLRPAARIRNTLQGCGGDGPTDHPNNTYGHGILDASQANEPFNIYTDRNTYSSGETMRVSLSLVNPANDAIPVDAYVAVEVPGGDLFFYDGFDFTEAPTPYAADYQEAPLVEIFDHPMLSYTFNGEASGDYTWYSALVAPGKDPLDPNQWLSIDSAPFTKN